MYVELIKRTSLPCKKLNVAREGPFLRIAQTTELG
jgi:hypothetical protein